MCGAFLFWTAENGLSALRGPAAGEDNTSPKSMLRMEMNQMRARILKIGVLCFALATLLLIFRFAPKRETSRPATTPSSTPAAAITASKPSETPGKSEHDMKVLEAALAKKPGHAPVLMNLAKMEEDKGQLDKAADYLQQIVKQEPGNVEARLELGRVLYQKGNIQGALDQTQAILKAHPDNADALYNLGAIYGNLGNTRLAREYWGRLIATDPKSESGKRAQEMMARLPAAPQ